jgi:hypothetical protein
MLDFLDHGDEYTDKKTDKEIEEMVRKNISLLTI